MCFLVHVSFGAWDSDSYSLGFWIFGFCCLFICLPVIVNVIQLDREIRTKWMEDEYIKRIIKPWMTFHIRALYVVCILSGSAFSAIEFCNSNLFQWEMCYMNLPRHSKQVFKNKRIFSVVLLENVPQLALQLSLYKCIQCLICVKLKPPVIMII